MNQKLVAAGGVLVGVAAVALVANELTKDKTPSSPLNSLTITNIFPEDEGASFRFFETVKLNIPGSDLGTVQLFMQTISLRDGSVKDLQFKEINLANGAKDSTFVQEWQNFAIGDGAFVEFFIFDQNNNALSMPRTITIGS